MHSICRSCFDKNILVSLRSFSPVLSDGSNNLSERLIVEENDLLKAGISGTSVEMLEISRPLDLIC